MAKSKAPAPPAKSSKTVWIAGSVLVVSAATAASWAFGLWGAEPPPPESAPAPTATASAKKAAAPVGQAAWLLANSQPKAAPTQRPEVPQDPNAGCGPSGEPCGDDAVCLDGGCVSTVCPVDAGAGCALSGGRIGSCCGTRCADLGADGANCGHCGGACEAGLDCVAGHCEARSCTGRMAGTACDSPAHETGACCRGACVEPSAWASDSANCGGCGHACAPGLTCKQGACIDAATGTEPTWTCMEQEHRCPEGSICVLDACYPRDCGADSEGLLCPTGTPGMLGHCCGHACTDFFTDKDNCRACGVHCAEGQICRAGECVAP